MRCEVIKACIVQCRISIVLFCLTGTRHCLSSSPSWLLYSLRVFVTTARIYLPGILCVYTLISPLLASLASPDSSLTDPGGKRFILCSLLRSIVHLVVQSDGQTSRHAESHSVEWVGNKQKSQIGILFRLRFLCCSLCLLLSVTVALFQLSVPAGYFCWLFLS